MPNWCYNKLTVYGPERDVMWFKEQAIGYDPWHHVRTRQESILNFHSFVPVPSNILAAGYGSAGFVWELTNWGCAGGACDADLLDDGPGRVTYAFNTAWTPPSEFLTKLGPQCPTLVFLLDYEELENGLKGIAKIHGQSVENHCLTF